MAEYIGLYYIPLELSMPECVLIQDGYVPVYASGNRVVKQYGYKYNYVTKNIKTPATPFTPELAALADIAKKECATRGLICDGYEFNQCIINKYEPGEGISKHIDLVGYGNVIACFSFGSGAVMDFEKNGDCIQLYVEHGSLYIMSGQSRLDYTHEMKRRKTDSVDGKRIKRNVRYSVTFRNVKF